MSKRRQRLVVGSAWLTLLAVRLIRCWVTAATRRPVPPQAAFEQQEDYMNDADPSVLRFLIASREEVSSMQVRGTEGC